jgi:hypothetical protein
MIKTKTKKVKQKSIIKFFLIILSKPMLHIFKNFVCFIALKNLIFYLKFNIIYTILLSKYVENIVGVLND